MTCSFSAIAPWLWCSLGWGLLLPAPALAQAITPAADGTGTAVNQNGTAATITGGTTNGGNLFHSFTDFSVPQGHSATFLADPAILNILGQVTGGNPSLIDGLLQVSGSNANLFLLNPAGILFGANGVLNLNGSFTAAAADGVTFANGSWNTLGTPDYATLVGDPTGFIFSSAHPGAVVNAGTLAVNAGESVTLLGGQVINTGAIAAPGGNILITAVEGESLVRIAQEGLLLNLEVATLPNGAGTPQPLTPATLPELLTGNGITTASGVTVNPDGTVTLTGSDVPLPNQAGTAIASGTLTASGGSVDVFGSIVGVMDALLDVSGDLGGGSIRIGGDYTGQGTVPNAAVTYIASNARLAADALTQGDGGRIIIWSDETTRTYGQLSARGGTLGGDGGFIETSSSGHLDIQGSPDLSAPAGTGGTWLIDPHNIILAATATSGIAISGGPPADTFTAVADNAILSLVDLANALDTAGSVIITTGTTGTQAGNITLGDNFTYTGSATATLTLRAANNINLNQSIASANPLNLQLFANNSITSLPGFGIDTAGGDLQATAQNGTLNLVNGFTVNTNGGDVNLSAGNGLILDAAITSDGGNVQLTGTSVSGPAVNIQNNANFTLDGGNLTINGTSSTGPSISAAVPLTTIGGNIILGGNNGIVVDSLNASGGPGGIISVFTGQFFQALNGGVVTSGGQAITIQHGGAGIIPFVVGNASVNGTAAAITNGVDAIAPLQSFLNTFIQGAISIISVPSSEGSGGSSGELDCLVTDTCPIFSDGGGIPSLLNTIPILTAEPNVVTNYTLTSLDIEESFTEDFVSYLNYPETVTLRDPADGGQILREIEEATGVKPAILYVYFAPQVVETTKPLVSQALLDNHLTKELSTPEALWRLTSEGLAFQVLPWQEARRPDNVPPYPTDPLELILITPGADPLRVRVPEAQRAEVVATVQSFRNEVADPSKVRTASYKFHGQNLYNWIIRPVEAELKAQEITNLSFILDSGLRIMPVAALHDGQQFIIQHYSVGLMPSLSLTDTRYRDARTLSVLAAGASQFDTLLPLPAVPIEVTTIAEKIWSGQILLNETFTLDNLKAQRQQQPFGIIHLATHGEFLPGDVSNSYIQLWDQRLRLSEVRQLGWFAPTVELVVLSACRLALGDTNAELGFAGMAVQSGAKSALASLWSVDDAGTMGLMLEFYQQLQTGVIKAEALRQAQLGMLNQEVTLTQGTVVWSGGTVTLPSNVSGSKVLSHPYFWSAFTLVGNPW